MEKNKTTGHVHLQTTPAKAQSRPHGHKMPAQPPHNPPHNPLAQPLHNPPSFWNPFGHAPSMVDTRRSGAPRSGQPVASQPAIHAAASQPASQQPGSRQQPDSSRRSKIMSEKGQEK